jgi:hypothetical protein
MHDAGMPTNPVPLIDYAAFIDSEWHDIILFVCKMLETYTMTELFSLSIIRFMKLTFKAEQIMRDKKKQEMAKRI